MGVEQQKKKLQDLILYILQRLRAVPKTKLAKLILLADREAYRLRGKSITGLHYVRLQYGPVVFFYEEILERGKEIGLWTKRDVDIQIWSEGETKTMSQYIPLSEISELPQEDREIVDHVLTEYSHKTGTELSGLTHRLPAWKYSEPYEPIHIAQLLFEDEDQYFAFMDILEDLEDAEEEELAGEISQALREMPSES